MIDFTLIGTAATMPLPDRALSSAVLRCGGRTILFDCGEGTQTAARKAHVSLMKTDLIALTHYHGDHIFGLPGLMQSMNCLERADTLYITGPDGLEENLAPILKLAGELKYEVKLISGTIQMNTLHPAWPNTAVLTSFSTRHRVTSCGYIFKLARPSRFLPEKAKEYGIPVKLWKELQRGKDVSHNGSIIKPCMVTGGPRKGLRIVFSGDTAVCDNLRDASRDADLLVCDATYAEDEQAELAEIYGHSTFSQAAKLAKESGAQRLWLTHYSQMIENPDEYILNARTYFPDAECAYDGKTIRLIFKD